MAFQANTSNLWTVGAAGCRAWELGLMAGTSPSIAALAGGGFQVAFQANTGSLWTVGTAGIRDWGLGMMGGTSPAITGLAGGGFQVAFQANTGSLWTVGTRGTADWHLGMMPETSPSIAALTGGNFQVAFQANTGLLWTAGSAGVRDWRLGLRSQTSPAIAGLPGGGFQMAFQANTGSLWTVGTAGIRDWGLGMMGGTSPAITALAGGGFHVAFQANTHSLWTAGTAGVRDWRSAMRADTSPSVATSSHAAPIDVGGKPNASNTGVPDGTPLEVHDGDMVITGAGTVVDAVDVRGSIYVRADNVTIRRSLIRGDGQGTGSTDALIASWWGNKGLLIQDTTVRADIESVNLDGISGQGFVAERVEIARVVDNVKVIGGNAVVKSSWLHDSTYSSNDPNQPDGVTHDDGVQVEGGPNTLIQGNNIENHHNAAVMVTQNYSVTSNLKVVGNWLRDGACTVNVTENPRGRIIGAEIRDNRFEPGHYGMTCPMRLPSTSPIALSGNTWLSTGAQSNPLWF